MRKVSEMNDKVSALLRKTADLLELDGANGYRIKAYRQAAQHIASLDRDIEHILKQDEDILRTIGLGEQMAEKVKQIFSTGSLTELTELENRLPSIFVTLLDLPGLLPEHVSRLYLELNITSLDDLKTALANDRVQKLQGFDEDLINTLKASLQ